MEVGWYIQLVHLTDIEAEIVNGAIGKLNVHFSTLANVQSCWGAGCSQAGGCALFFEQPSLCPPLDPIIAQRYIPPPWMVAIFIVHVNAPFPVQSTILQVFSCFSVTKLRHNECKRFGAIDSDPGMQVSAQHINPRVDLNSQPL
jgi:hypothetical protein